MKIMLSKAMGNSHQSSPYPRIKYSNNNQSSAPPQNVEDFERRWKAFIQSLDVTPQNIQNIDQLEASQKMELLMNFESKNPKCSAFHYVTLIKGLRSFKMTNSKKKDEFQNAKQILSATEISLRTNNVEWVYDFLKHNGLEILVDYMSQTLLHLIKFEDIQISPYISNYSMSPTGRTGDSLNLTDNVGDGDFLSSTNQSLRRIFDNSNIRYNNRISGSCRSRNSAINRTHSSAATKISGSGGSNVKSHSNVGDSIKECIHLCLKCFRTILNNQKGCRMAFEHKDTINVITLCLLHPSYQTKSLVLDLLSAVCLIESGHERVLKAFDIFKAMTAEERRFETLMYYYRHHETLPLDDYNIDYAVSNMQFINIVVHSVDNINLRVYLQFEFTLLGLDDFLKKLQDRPGDRLNRQVDAYLDNTVDCSVLLEDAEAKDAYVSECERLERDVANLQEAVSVAEAEKARKLKDGEERVRKAEKELDKAKTREDELSLLVESLRSKIRDINVNLSDRESDMQKEILELQQQLKLLGNNLSPQEIIKNGDINEPMIDKSFDIKTKILDDVVEVTDDSASKHPVSIPPGSTSHVNSLPKAPIAKSSKVTQPNKILQNVKSNKDTATSVTIEVPNKIQNSGNGHYDEHMVTDLLDSAISSAANKKSTKSSHQMEKSVTSGTGSIVDTSFNQEASSNVGAEAAPLIKWNILRNQQGTVFEHIDGSKIEKHLDLDCFERIFKVPPPLPVRNNCQENEYDVPPNADTIDANIDNRRTYNVAQQYQHTNKQAEQMHNNNTQLTSSTKNISSISTGNTPSTAITTSNTTVNSTLADQDEKISLLDQNRKQCLKVVVDYLKQEQLLLSSSVTFREWGRPLARAITNFELSSEAADRLLYQLPSYQEIDMYHDIAGDNLNVLADEDRLVALLSCIDRIEMKLEAILYMHAFDETFFGLQEKIRTVALACKSVMDSERLKKILEIVLAFGNRMNDSRRGKALGFRIQSLDMLPECRSPDDKWSLMNYIVFSIEDKFSDLLIFLTELESVEDASRVSLCNLMAAIEELNQGLDRVADELGVIRDAVQANPDLIPMKLVNFVKENTSRVSLLKNQAEQARMAFVKTVEWFGEKDLNTASPDLFFGTLTRFMESFKKAMAENSRRKVGVSSPASSATTNHKRRHKDRKMTDSKTDASRKKNRTRQINADGIMDDILAGLDFQPLQVGIHGGRSRTKKDVNGGESEVHNIFLDNN